MFWHDGQVEKTNYPRQNALTTLPASQSTHIQSVPSFNTPEPSQRREVPTQLAYDPPVCSSQPVAESGTWTGHRIHLIKCIRDHMIAWSQEVVFLTWAAGVAATDASGAVSSGAPLTSVQMNFVRNMIHEALEDFRCILLKYLHTHTIYLSVIKI